VRDALTSFLRDHRDVREWLLRSGASIGADASAQNEISPTIGSITRGSYPDRLSTQEMMNMKDSPFQVHVLNGRGLAKAARLQHLFELTLDLVKEITGSGDALIGGDLDLSACEAALVTASFHAKRSMACKYENQRHEDNAAGMETSAVGDYLRANKSAEVGAPRKSLVTDVLYSMGPISKQESDQLIDIIKLRTLKERTL
jgi:hypothetical protein